MNTGSEIFSNSGDIVAHPGKQYLGKTIAETLLYDALMLHPEIIADVIPYADAYIESHSPASGADEARDEAYEGMSGFVSGLQAYAQNMPGEKPDLSLLTPELAEAMLEALPGRQAYVQDVSRSIADGEMYISSGDDYYTVYMPIKFSADTNPWSVAVNVPMDKVLQVSNDIRNYVIIVCVISIGAIAFMLYVIASSVTKPLLKLANASRQLGEGNFNVELPGIQSNDEIGVLSKAFKVMAEKIDDLVKKLQNYAKKLEEKNAHLRELNETLVATNHVAETVLNVEHHKFHDVLEESLRILGESVSAAGVSIWENFVDTDGKVYSRRLSAWIAGEHDHIARSQTVIDLDKFLPGWNRQAHKKNGGCVVFDGRALVQNFDVFQYCSSLFLIPLMLHDSYWGFIAFSYKSEHYRMKSDESEILRSGGMMVASAVIQNQISEELEEAEEMASTDPLTGLTNRNGFLLKAPGIYAAARAEHSPLTMLFFDLDHFKDVNDAYGHPFGDEVLKAFASIVKRETRPEDVSCRYGGEEFILLLSNCPASPGKETAQRILQSVQDTRFPDCPDFSITVSIGMITAIPGAHDSLNGYIQKADTALYTAKKNGRNRVVIYEDQKR